MFCHVQVSSESTASCNNPLLAVLKGDFHVAEGWYGFPALFLWATAAAYYVTVGVGVYHLIRFLLLISMCMLQCLHRRLWRNTWQTQPPPWTGWLFFPCCFLSHSAGRLAQQCCCDPQRKRRTCIYPLALYSFRVSCPILMTGKTFVFLQAQHFPSGCWGGVPSGRAPTCTRQVPWKMLDWKMIFFL